MQEISAHALLDLMTSLIFQHTDEDTLREMNDVGARYAHAIITVVRTVNDLRDAMPQIVEKRTKQPDVNVGQLAGVRLRGLGAASCREESPSVG